MIKRLLLVVAAVTIVAFVAVAGTAYWLFSRDGFRTALESQASSWLGHPVKIGGAKAQLFPRIAVQLTGIAAGERSELTLDEVQISADLRPLFSGRIENADVRVSGSVIDMPLPFALPQTADEDGARAQDAGAVRIVSIRSISLRSVRLRSRGREVVVSGESALKDDTLVVERFTADAGGTTLSAEGTIALSPRIDARMKASADRLDLDELLALADAFSTTSNAKGKSAAKPMRIQAMLQAQEATAAGVQARNLSTELAVDGDAVSLKPLSFELFGGRYDGALSARMGKRLSATLESRISHLDVAQLAAFGGSPDTITGTLSGTGTFKGSGDDMAGLLRELRGSATAEIVDGNIRRLHLVRTVILFFGRPAPDTGEGTDRFERISAAFALADRVVRAHQFSLHSNDADITGTGSLDLDTDALDGRAEVLLSEALSAQAGTDLYRYTRQGNRVLLPAAIGGTLAKPRLTIDLAAAAKRGIQNEIGRRIGDLFKGLGGSPEQK